ncbi:MAG TPA: sensor histidine kinase [Jiangellales bacterium]|nr:sensor histidine kinase [Jiangellales bacterium]
MARLRWWRGSARDRRAGLLVLAGLVGFVGVVYVTVVLGGGALIGQTRSPHVGLSVLATAIVALGFEPVRARLDRLATRVVHGGRPSPYEVLSRFSDDVIGSYPSEELPGRMAKVLAEGTGAEWAQVWLVVHGRLALAATWPRGVDAETPPAPEDPPGLRSHEVRHAGELLGVLRLRTSEGRPLTPVEERLFAGLAAQSGLVLRGARLRAELAERLAELSVRAEELRLSRRRLVDMQDDERRRLERDIHDGAQQHLVALTVNLRLAQTLVQRAPERAAAVISAQRDAAGLTIETLLSLARGIYPRSLREEGVTAALEAVVGTSALPVEVTATGVGRYPAPVEAAVYFCCLEALQNAAKHSGARHVDVRLHGDDHGLTATVQDDGRGMDGARFAGGAGLSNMRDRIDAVGGTLTVESQPGRGVTVRARVPAALVPAPRSHGTVPA